MGPTSRWYLQYIHWRHNKHWWSSKWFDYGSRLLSFLVRWSPLFILAAEHKRTLYLWIVKVYMHVVGMNVYAYVYVKCECGDLSGVIERVCGCISDSQFL